ncbi:putative ribonuclease H-like domain-containing protein [Tanacetum coccineum]|uniref:Ribonuclease H-like domain-containing protein n=1 Tax=Tanacetum coccineum TaxID=301880 RepID=A0ABQ5G0K9_9ASTR
MCDASDFAVGAVLGQRIDGKFKPIYYASKTLNNAQERYTTTEKELLAVVFSFDKFHTYLVLSKTVVYTDHFALKYLFREKNLAAEHLSRLENPDLGTFTKDEIVDEFPDEHQMILKADLNNDKPWYVDYLNYIVGKIVPPKWTPEKRRRFFSQVKTYFWDEPYAFRLCPDNVMRQCVAGSKILEILAHCHSGPTGGHHSASITGRKIYESGFFWPSIFKDAKDYIMRCDACQRSGNISSRSEIPQNNIHVSLWESLSPACKDLTTAAKNRFMELNELKELRDGSYKNTRIYKERTKKWHDSRLRGDKNFKVGDKVLLFNSRFKMHLGTEIRVHGFSYNLAQDLAGKEIDNVGKVSTIWKSRSVGVVKSQDDVMEFESAQSNTTAKLPILKLVPVTAAENDQQDDDGEARSLATHGLSNDINLHFQSIQLQKKIVSRLAILGVVITQEDLNSKFLRSLPPEWNTHVVVWMNKADIETMSIDDLYNNFKIIEQDVKKSVGASSGAQNLAFMTAPSTSSTNDVNTANPAYEVSTVSPNINIACPQVSTANFSDNTVYAFMVENPNGSNLLQQNLEQIHKDDLEAMDLKWPYLLSMRAKRYFQRTGKKIFINANDTAGYDKSKVECFNCYKMRHFARECRAPRNKKSQFKYQDNTRKQGNNEDTSSKVMLAIDGVGFDWSDMAEEQVQTNMALMAFSESEVYNDKTCSKTCLKNYETLKKQCDNLIVKLNQTEFTAAIWL